MTKPNSIGFLATGFDGKPVMVKFLGFRHGSNNTKTGSVIQSYMLPLAWVEQKRVGDDYGVCGSCRHSQANDGDCYVRKGSAQMGLFGTMKKYPDVMTEDVTDHLGLFLGRFIRFGSYGEPVLMGENVIRSICSVASNWTGYTHVWAKPEYQWAKQYFMASVDTDDEYRTAKDMGWRTFRVRQPEAALFRREISCPASKEAGHKTTCNECALCKGASSKAKDVTIIKH